MFEILSNIPSIVYVCIFIWVPISLAFFVSFKKDAKYAKILNKTLSDREKHLRRYREAQDISCLLKNTEPNSDDEGKLLVLLDRMNLSFEEYCVATFGLEFKRPRVTARRIELLETKYKTQ